MTWPSVLSALCAQLTDAEIVHVDKAGIIKSRGTTGLRLQVYETNCEPIILEFGPKELNLVYMTGTSSYGMHWHHESTSLQAQLKADRNSD
jgi:hypothetical protein